MMKTLWAVGAVAMMMGSLVKADEAAEQVLKAARYTSTLTESQDLHGHMRKNGKKTPVSLFLRGENLQFLYRVGKDKKRFHMRLKEGDFALLEVKDDGKTSEFNSKKLAQRINGTDLTYEDLSLRFLYWSKSSIEGQEKVSGQMCYKLRLENPDGKGDYQIVYVWIHKKYGALMKVIGYNKAGKPLKQFQVKDLMRVGKEYTLKRMRVDTINPDTQKVTGVTYLEFKKPRKVKKRQ